MKKRKLNIAGKTGMAAVLFLTALGVNSTGIMAMQDAGGAVPAIAQEAVWSTDAEGRADVTWRVRGLYTYIAERGTEAPVQASDVAHASQGIQSTEKPAGEMSGESEVLTSGEDSEGKGIQIPEGTAAETEGEVLENTEEMSDGMQGSYMEEVSAGEYRAVFSGDTGEGSAVPSEPGTEEMYENMREKSTEGVYAGTETEYTGETDGGARAVPEGEISQMFFPETSGGCTAENMVYVTRTSLSEEPKAVLAASEKYEEETPVQTAFYVVDYVSEYFTVVRESLPDRCTLQQISVTGQDGTQTTVTKLVWPVDLPCADEITGGFQIELKEGFRNSEKEIICPVSQDEPLKKDCTGAGLFLAEQQGEEVRTAAFAAPCTLTVSPKVRGEAELRMEIKPSSESIRAGESLTYICRVENTGEQALSDIRLESSFSDPETKAVWESGDLVQVSGKQAKIASLDPGQGQTLHMTVVPDEGLSSSLTHTVSLEAFCEGSQQMLRREAAETVQIQPLEADFEVEKTADRTTVVPGDTITYQICIRNTGERTLHSVLSTERFLNANVQAQFLPKDGVTLNSTRTQALISEIAPGEAFALLASVTIPQYFTEQELINEVTVISEETGTKSLQATSSVQVVRQYITGTPTPAISAYYKNAGTSGAAYPAYSKPATGDRTEILLPVVLLVLSMLLGLKAYSSMKKR